MQCCYFVYLSSHNEFPVGITIAMIMHIFACSFWWELHSYLEGVYMLESKLSSSLVVVQVFQKRQSRFCSIWRRQCSEWVSVSYSNHSFSNFKSILNCRLASKYSSALYFSIATMTTVKYIDHLFTLRFGHLSFSGFRLVLEIFMQRMILSG